MALSDVRLRALKPRDKAYKVPDADGLYIEVRTSGAKLWRFLGFLEELRELTGPDGFVFPAFHTSKRPMSENTINQAFRRMGYATGEVTAHGLRTTASSLLNESGKWSPDAIERSLAHADPNAVRGIYNRGRYWDERVAMHQWWSDYLDALRDSKMDQAKSLMAA